MLPLHTDAQQQQQRHRIQSNEFSVQSSTDLFSNEANKSSLGAASDKDQQQHYLSIPQLLPPELSPSQSHESRDEVATSNQQSRQSPSLDSSRGTTGVMSMGNNGISDIALLLSGAIKLKTHTSGKPPYSYATLITYAIMQHPRNRMTLNEIYAWVMEHYPYFKTAGSGWKNSIRHNLSLSKTFVRIPRPINEPGKGAYWTVDLAVLDATIHNRTKPPAHRYSLPRGGQANEYGASVGVQPIPQNFTGLPALPTQALNPGAMATPPFVMGVTSSISEMGLVQNAPHPGNSLAFRRASLQTLPTQARYQPYPMPAQLGLGRNRPYQQGLLPGASYAQQLLSNINPFAPAMTNNLYPGAIPSAGDQNTTVSTGQPSGEIGPPPMLPAVSAVASQNRGLGIPLMSSNTIPTAAAEIPRTGVQIIPASAAASACESGSDSQPVKSSDTSNSHRGSALLISVPEYSSMLETNVANNENRSNECNGGSSSSKSGDIQSGQLQILRGDNGGFDELKALSFQAYPQVKPTPSLPEHLLQSYNTLSDIVHSRRQQQIHKELTSHSAASLAEDTAGYAKDVQKPKQL
ncbi:hypothetical protein GGI26_003691 [Coemansia sp. RSA 1358]|nr:hypothetical protein EDC05_000679 [Coemansia umbellata]KAJ2621987.1 hypothetical protein GGI26_003691 [Coemansia sp. RSA 1358]